MAGLDAVKLAQWLRGAMMNPKLPRLEQIVLQHSFSSGDVKTAGVWDWNESEPLPRVEDLIQEITEKADDYANGVADGVVRYILEAYHKGNGQPWGNKLPFHVIARSPEAESAALGKSEPATPAGVTAQLMRHLENREDKFNKLFDMVQKIFTKRDGDLQTRVDSYESRHLDTVRLYEDLLDRRHDRELNAVYRAKQDARHAKAWDLLFSIGPTIAAQILSPKMAMALPSQVTDGGPAMHIVRQFMKTIEDDQMGSLAGILKPEQTIMLLQLNDLVSKEVDRNNALEEEQKHIVPASADDMRRVRAERQASAPASAPEMSAAPNPFAIMASHMAGGAQARELQEHVALEMPAVVADEPASRPPSESVSESASSEATPEVSPPKGKLFSFPAIPSAALGSIGSSKPKASRARAKKTA